jgi:hypothetical protein
VKDEIKTLDDGYENEEEEGELDDSIDQENDGGKHISLEREQFNVDEDKEDIESQIEQDKNEEEDNKSEKGFIKNDHLIVHVDDKAFDEDAVSRDEIPNNLDDIDS